MIFLPQVKEAIKGKKRSITGCKFIFPANCDERLINLSKKIPTGNKIVEINIEGTSGQGYKILLEDKIQVFAQSTAAAFYAMQTIRQIVKSGYYDVSEITDAPDYETRGFYFDITRGRIPTMAALKELVDNLAYYKVNMLQLYVEHVFPFKEYDGIYQRTGYMTAEETKELDAYCRENFIELVPSLSCFGHLYELLSDDRYKDLCELVNYKPQTIDWQQRMAHHTINPLDERSIEIIKSLIDQYAPLFTSDKFNICCDETFDLGTDRNKGKNKGQIYVDFVSKIIKHVKSKGKTPMMWGDVINAHYDLIDQIDEDVILLSWGYSANVNSDTINKVRDSGRKQYVCPGCNNWTSLIEMLNQSIPNITKMAKYGYEAGAQGLLNTCWGDYGHISPIYACMYSVIFAAAKSWNVNCEYKNFDMAMDKYYYGYKGASKIVKAISYSYRSCYWYELVCDYSNRQFGNDVMKCWRIASPDELRASFAECEDVIPYLMATKWENESAREALLVVAQGTQCMAAMLMSLQTGEKLGYNMSDAEEWIKEYGKIYLKESKMGELKEIVKVVHDLSARHLK